MLEWIFMVLGKPSQMPWRLTFERVAVFYVALLAGEGPRQVRAPRVEPRGKQPVGRAVLVPLGDLVPGAQGGVLLASRVQLYLGAHALHARRDFLS